MHELDKYVIVLEDVVDKDLREEFIGEYNNSSDWVESETGGGLDKNIRNSAAIATSAPGIIQRNPVCRMELDRKFFNCASKAIQAYSDIFPLCTIESDSGYEILRYQEGQFYTEHTDSFKKIPRAVSCSFALNDDYEGGEWGFWGRSKILKPPVGSALMFPSNFMFPHEIMPVTKGTRYSVITWFI